MRHSTLFLALTAVLVAGCETPTTPAIRPSADVIAASSPTTFSGEATVVQVQVTPIGAPAPVGINLVETGKLPESGGALNATLLQLSISKEQTGGLISPGQAESRSGDRGKFERRCRGESDRSDVPPSAGQRGLRCRGQCEQHW